MYKDKDKKKPNSALDYEAERNMIASEALYGFAGWLTSRDDEVIASAHHDAAIWARLVSEFIKVNRLDQPRDGWEKRLLHPTAPNAAL